MNTPSRPGAKDPHRRALAAVARLPVLAVSQSACSFSIGTSTPPAGAASGSGGGVDFDGVQSATIQMAAIGTFVHPEGAFEAAANPYVEWREKDITTAQDVSAAGFPLGDPTFTTTRGIVSKAETAGENPAGVHRLGDRARRPHARRRLRGPRVDPDGRVVGVDYAGNDQHGTNLAIHRDEAVDVVGQLAAGERVLSLGINAQALTGEDGIGLGFWVASVAAGSPAGKPGIEPGHLLTRMQDVTLGIQGTMSEYCDVLRTQGRDAALDVEPVRPADGRYSRGQFNSDAPIEAVTVLGAGSGSGASYLVVAALDLDSTHAIVVAVQANTEADLTVADRALGSFFAGF